MAVAKVVENHLPSSTGPALYPHGARRAEQYARALLLADIYATDAFGVSEDLHFLETAERSLRNAAEAILNLSPSAVRSLSFARGDDDLMHAAENPLVAYRRASVRLTRLRAEISSLKDMHRHQRRAGKVNYRAASVARQARFVWAEEHFEATPEEFPFTKPNPNALSDYVISDEDERNAVILNRSKYLEHLATFAKKTEHNTRPSGFGQFLEDLFLVVGIVRDDDPDEPVRAASALRALSKLEANQK